jgi:hypothetical protein
MSQVLAVELTFGAPGQGAAELDVDGEPARVDLRVAAPAG